MNIEEGEVVQSEQPVEQLRQINPQGTGVWTKFNNLDNKTKFFYLAALLIALFVVYEIANSFIPHKQVRSNDLTPTISPTDQPTDTPAPSDTPEITKAVTPTSVPTSAPTATPTVAPTSIPILIQRDSFKDTDGLTKTFAFPSSGEIRYSVNKINIKITKDGQDFIPNQTINGDNKFVVTTPGNYTLTVTPVDGTVPQYTFTQWY